MFPFRQESVPYKVVKGCPAHIEVLTGLVLAHPVIRYLGQHGDDFPAFLLCYV